MDLSPAHSPLMWRRLPVEIKFPLSWAHADGGAAKEKSIRNEGQIVRMITHPSAEGIEDQTNCTVIKANSGALAIQYRRMEGNQLIAPIR